MTVRISVIAAGDLLDALERGLDQTNRSALC
eukprot:COSAG02_NODE_51131_length_316_cov_0.705069_2_plen_30_part_01